MKQYLEIGKIVSVQGIKGEVRVQPWCDSPEFLCEFEELYLDSKGEKTIEILSVRVQKNVVVMKIDGVNTVEAAEKMRGTTLYIDRDDIELDENSYFVQDLIGLSVFDEVTNENYGEIVEVSQTGANDVYHIKNSDGKIRLIPAIADVVLETNLEERKMVIHVLEGLFDED